jgi:hypothetical protein
MADKPVIACIFLPQEKEKVKKLLCADPNKKRTKTLPRQSFGLRPT